MTRACHPADPIAMAGGAVAAARALFLFGRSAAGLAGLFRNLLARGGCLVLVGAAMLAAPAAQGAQYAITITDGATFSMPAFLVTSRTITRRAETTNGVNPIDVAIITSGSPLVGVRGALWFGTNTAFCRLISCTTAASRIDVAFVRVNRARTRVAIRVDGNVFGLPSARLNIFNIYNLTSGITAQIHHVLRGRILIRFQNKRRAVRGTIRLQGSSGFTGPFPTSRYFARFSGRLVRRR